MYICVCKAITDKQIEEAAKSAANFNEVCKRLGVGSECGLCLQDIINTKKSKINKKPAKNSSSPS